MTRLTNSLAVIAATALFLSGGRLAPAAENPHAYFEALVASAAHWKSYSLRSDEQVLQYKHANSIQPYVTYSPATDPDPNRQDAAKITIPAFMSMKAGNGAPITLAAPLGASDTFVKVSEFHSSVWSNGRNMRIGNEVLAVNRPSGTVISNNLVPVVRGQAGTSAVAHASGSLILASNNSLLNQVRLPLGTENGNSYLFTWDDYHTDSYLNTGLTNHKAYQFTSKGPGSLWMEPQTRFDGGSKAAGRPSGYDHSKHVAGIEVRAYQEFGGPADWSQTNGNQMGPGTSNNQPIMPKAKAFIKHPNRWTRHWFHIVQRANDYDTLNYWVADEEQDPVQIYKDIPISVIGYDGNPDSIFYFWLEYNTSTDEFKRGSLRDLVSYFRNFVALRNVGNVQALLQRPNAGIPLPPLEVYAPGNPANLRIVSGMD